MRKTLINKLRELPFIEDINLLSGEIFSVGGAVRDEFLDKDSKDLDILITGVPIEMLKIILKKHGRVDAVGASFGVLKFKAFGDDEDVDIAIPRREKLNGEGGHKGFVVEGDHNMPIDEDLYRRDFTINSIAKSMYGEIIDPYNGRDDLEKGLIRLVNPLAFSEDPLRMLRAVQFASRFDFEIEPLTMRVIKNTAHKINEIAPERILIEFEKIVSKGDPYVGAKLLVETGLYAHIFSKNNLLDFNDENWDNIKTMGDFIYMLSEKTYKNVVADFFKYNLGGDSETYNEIRALEFCFSNADLWGDIHMCRQIVYKMYNTSSKSINSKLLSGNVSDAVEDLLNSTYPKTLKELEVDGNDLMELGLIGKKIGDTLSMILHNIYKDKLVNNKKDILEWVKFHIVG